MALLVNTAEGQSDGTTATTGNTGSGSGDAFSSVSASVITFESTGAINNALSYLTTQPTTGSTAFVAWDDAAASASFTGRFYFSFPTLPSATHQFVGIRSLSAGLGSIEISTTGQVRGIAGSATGTFSTPVLSTNTVYRIEFQGTGWGTGSATFDIQVYVGNATGTPHISLSVPSSSTAAQVQRFRYGKPGTSSLFTGYLMDDFAQNVGSSTAIGPSAANYTRTVDDLMGIDDDAANQRIDIGDVFNDNIGLTDSIVVTVGRGVSVTDNMGITDTRAVTQTKAFADNLGLTDTTTVSIGRNVTFDETLGLTDSMVVLVSQERIQSDTEGITDSIVISKSNVYSDNLGLTDGITVLQTTAHARTVDDNLGLTDSIAVTQSDQLDDTLGLTDSIVLSRSVVLGELLGLSDDVNVQASGSAAVSVSDTLGLTDTTSVVTTSIRSQSDTEGLSDTVAITLERILADNMGLTDTLSVTQSDVFNDNMGLTDDVTVLLSLFLTRTDDDDLGLTDTIQVSRSSVLAELLGLSDTVSVGRAVSTEDTMVVSDTISVTNTLGVADDLGLSDELTISRGQVLADGVGLTDSIGIVHIQPIVFTRVLLHVLGLSDDVLVEHVIKHNIPPYFTVGNRRTYVTDGSKQR